MRCPVQYDRETTMAFLKDRLKVLLAQPMPPVLAEDDEGHWECDYCPLAEPALPNNGWSILTQGNSHPGSPFFVWTTGYSPVSKNRASGNLIRRYVKMATQNSNGKASVRIS